MFVDQSQSAQGETIEKANGNVDEESSSSEDAVKGAFYRICDVPSKPCDDSPLETIEHPERITSRKRTVFGHEGKMVQTDGTGKNTKLTKIYKRDDNRNALLKALRRMKLNF